MSQKIYTLPLINPLQEQMKLTRKQALMLYEIAVHTLPIVGGWPYSKEERAKLVNEIINQQENEILMDFSQNEI